MKSENNYSFLKLYFMIAPLLTKIVVKQFNHNPPKNMNIMIAFPISVLIDIKPGIPSYASQLGLMILLVLTTSVVK